MLSQDKLGFYHPVPIQKSKRSPPGMGGHSRISLTQLECLLLILSDLCRTEIDIAKYYNTISDVKVEEKIHLNFMYRVVND